MLWDSDLPIQEYSDTHVCTTIYDQGSFEPVARLMWLRDDIPQPINDEPIIRQDNPHIKVEVEFKSKIQVFHYHNDQLGTPNELTNDKGEVVWLADYESWGNTAKVVYNEVKINQIAVSQAHLQPIRFQGQHFDTETGLHYNRFRYYDPDMGMFTTRDPIGLRGGDNVFAYAPNPTGWIDPLGLNPLDPMNGPWTNPSKEQIEASAKAARRNAELARQQKQADNSIAAAEGYDFYPPTAYDKNKQSFWGSKCGAEDDWRAAIIPDWVFTDACAAHDECYATCGMSKAVCDANFIKNGASEYAYALTEKFKGSSQKAYNSAQKASGCGSTCNGCP